MYESHQISKYWKVSDSLKQNAVIHEIEDTSLTIVEGYEHENRKVQRWWMLWKILKRRTKNETVQGRNFRILYTEKPKAHILQRSRSYERTLLLSDHKLVGSKMCIDLYRIYMLKETKPKEWIVFCPADGNGHRR